MKDILKKNNFINFVNILYDKKLWFLVTLVYKHKTDFKFLTENLKNKKDYFFISYWNKEHNIMEIKLLLDWVTDLNIFNNYFQIKNIIYIQHFMYEFLSVFLNNYFIYQSKSDQVLESSILLEDSNTLEENVKIFVKENLLCEKKLTNIILLYMLEDHEFIKMNNTQYNFYYIVYYDYLNNITDIIIKFDEKLLLDRFLEILNFLDFIKVISYKKNTFNFSFKNILLHLINVILGSSSLKLKYFEVITIVEDLIIFEFHKVRIKNKSFNWMLGHSIIWLICEFLFKHNFLDFILSKSTRELGTSKFLQEIKDFNIKTLDQDSNIYLSFSLLNNSKIDYVDIFNTFNYNKNINDNKICYNNLITSLLNNNLNKAIYFKYPKTITELELVNNLKSNLKSFKLKFSKYNYKYIIFPQLIKENREIIVLYNNIPNKEIILYFENIKILDGSCTLVEISSLNELISTIFYNYIKYKNTYDDMKIQGSPEFLNIFNSLNISEELVQSFLYQQLLNKIEKEKKELYLVIDYSGFEEFLRKNDTEFSRNYIRYYEYLIFLANFILEIEKNRFENYISKYFSLFKFEKSIDNKEMLIKILNIMLIDGLNEKDYRLTLKSIEKFIFFYLNIDIKLNEEGLFGYNIYYYISLFLYNYQVIDFGLDYNKTNLEEIQKILKSKIPIYNKLSLLIKSDITIEQLNFIKEKWKN